KLEEAKKEEKAPEEKKKPKVDEKAPEAVDEAPKEEPTEEKKKPVKEAPVAESEFDVVEVKVGETAQLFVNVRGMDVKCTWTKDGKPIKATKNITPSYKDGTAQLIIKDAEAFHSGVYNLKATNADGTGSADVTLVVKSVPSAPEGPLNVVIDGSMCKLSWKAPTNDGNSAILGYYIEKFDEKRKKWNFVARCVETSYKTDTAGSAGPHRFRVAAENAVGTGPTIESEAVAAGLKPEIVRPKGDATFVFNEGDTAELNFSFKGEPSPTVEWTDNAGKPISDTATYKIKNTPTSTLLTIKNITSKHAGQYKLKIKNRNGEDVLPVTVQVRQLYLYYFLISTIHVVVQVKGRPEAPGKPGKPSVDEQNVDSLRLSWLAPKEDGGSPITQYIVEMRT
ncbi:immunoglobulin I-set domain protein, partial [Ancylostoma duodenale]